VHVVVVVVVVVVVEEEEEEDDGLLQHHVKKLASWTCKSLIQIMWKQTQFCKISVCSASCKLQKKITFFGNPIISCMWQ
jgi:hypothetical protein